MESIDVISELPLLNEHLNDQKPRDSIDGDAVDATPKNPFFSHIDTLATIGGLITFTLDVGSDIFLSYTYFTQGEIANFGYTMFFVLMPAIITNVISFSWYLFNDPLLYTTSNVSRRIWALRLISHLFLLGSVHRYLESWYYGSQSDKYLGEPTEQQHFYKRMLKTDADICSLRLVETFMESAPQLILQLYIIVSGAQVFCHRPTSIVGRCERVTLHHILSSKPADQDEFGLGKNFQILAQSFTIITSLLSIAFSLTSHARAQRFIQKEKKNIKKAGLAYHFFWHFFTIEARVLALALFASAFNHWCAVVAAVRLVVMTTWFAFSGNSRSSNKIQKFLLDVVRGFIHLFAFVKVYDEPTFRKYVFYYTYEIIEDVILVGLWCWAIDPALTWFFNIALIVHFGGVCVGLVFMIVYYRHLHPGPVPKEISLETITESVQKRSPSCVRPHRHYSRLYCSNVSAEVHKLEEVCHFPQIQGRALCQ